jgi:DNA-binding response OmpR family regulator
MLGSPTEHIILFYKLVHFIHKNLHSTTVIAKFVQPKFKSEQEVLNLLTTNVNQTVEPKYLLKTVWGDDSFFNSRTLDVYICKLREYFSDDNSIDLITLKGKGYLFLEK